MSQIQTAERKQVVIGPRGERVMNRSHPRRPRLGFLGVGWIGRNRLEALVRSDVAEVAAIADLSPELRSRAAELTPSCAVCDSLSGVLEHDLDGIVIATPSALHADQAIAALEQGIAVFCQKPLGRTAAETLRVTEAARRNNVLLGIDMSYRFVSPVTSVRELCRSGELGEIYAADLVFHNAYGPDKAWFYDRMLSGGGCLLDLGIHLVDLGLWFLDFPTVSDVTGRVFANGARLRDSEVEDYAVARLDLAGGQTIQIACSWKLPAGCDAVIRGTFYGTKGGASFYNVEGSFYRFASERYQGTKRQVLVDAPEDWGGRAAVDWAHRLARGEGYAKDTPEIGKVAEVLDRIYANCRPTEVSGPTAETQAESVGSDATVSAQKVPVATLCP